jgi:hypothetical protein
MEEIVVSVKDFLSQIASPRGLKLESIERTFRQEIAGGSDFRIVVGSESKHYVIPVDALKKYFEQKDKPVVTLPADDKGAFEDFMKDGPAVPAAKAPAAKAKDVK